MLDSSETILLIFNDVIAKDTTNEAQNILSAVHSLILEQELPLSITSFYAAFLSSLRNPEPLSQSQLTATLYLLTSLIESIPVAVLIKQCVTHTDVLLHILKSYVEDDVIIPAALSCSVTFLSSLPASMSPASSVRSLFDLIFYFLTHPNDTISSRASLLLPRLFSTETHAVVSASLVKFVSSVVQDAARSPDSVSKAFGLTTKVVDFIHFGDIWTLIEEAQKVGQKSRATGPALSFVFQAVQTFTLEHRDVVLTNFPTIFELFISPCISLTRSDIITVQKRCMKLLKVLKPFLLNSTDELEITCVTNISNILLSYFSIQTRLAWTNLLSITNIFFSITNKLHRQMLMKLFRFVFSLLDDAHLFVLKNSKNSKSSEISFNEALLRVGRTVVGTIVTNFGLDFVLSDLASLNLDPSQQDASSCPRPWLVWSIVKGAQNSKLSIFFDQFLPLSRMLKSRAQSIKSTNNETLIKAAGDFEILALQLLECFSSLCRSPVDMSTEFSKVLEFISGVFKFKEGTEAILPTVKGLYRLITTCCMTYEDFSQVVSVFEPLIESQSEEIDDELESDDESGSDSEHEEEDGIVNQSRMNHLDSETVKINKSIIAPHCRQLLIALLDLFSSSVKSVSLHQNQLKSECRKQILETVYVLSLISPFQGVMNFLSETIKKTFALVQASPSDGQNPMIHVYSDLIHVFSLATICRQNQDTAKIKDPGVLVLKCLQSLLPYGDSALLHKIFRLAANLASISNDEMKQEAFNLAKSCSHLLLTDWVGDCVIGLKTGSAKVRKSVLGLLSAIAHDSVAHDRGVDGVLRSLFRGGQSIVIDSGLITAFSSLILEFEQYLNTEIFEEIGEFIHQILISPKESMTSECSRSVLLLLKRMVSFRKGRQLVRDYLLTEILVFFKYWYNHSAKSAKNVRYLIEKFIKKFGGTTVSEACQANDNLSDFFKVIHAVDKSLRRKTRKDKAEKNRNRDQSKTEKEGDLVVPTSLDLLDDNQTQVHLKTQVSQKNSRENTFPGPMIQEDSGKLVIKSSFLDSKDDGLDLSQVIRAGSVENESKVNRKRRKDDGQSSKKTQRDSKGHRVIANNSSVAVVALNPAHLKKRSKKSDVFAGLIKGAQKGAKAKQKRRK
ncbi:hypothetical protein GEMRC1_004105 [Eukaryota sp. GEM-RC1]